MYVNICIVYISELPWDEIPGLYLFISKSLKNLFARFKLCIENWNFLCLKSQIKSQFFAEALSY